MYMLGKTGTLQIQSPAIGTRGTAIPRAGAGRHYDVTDLNQLFKTVSSKRILDFVKDIGLYNSL